MQNELDQHGNDPWWLTRTAVDTPIPQHIDDPVAVLRAWRAQGPPPPPPPPPPFPKPNRDQLSVLHTPEQRSPSRAFQAVHSPLLSGRRQPDGPRSVAGGFGGSCDSREFYDLDLAFGLRSPSNGTMGGKSGGLTAEQATIGPITGSGSGGSSERGQGVRLTAEQAAVGPSTGGGSCGSSERGPSVRLAPEQATVGGPFGGGIDASSEVSKLIQRYEQGLGLNPGNSDDGGAPASDAAFAPYNGTVSNPLPVGMTVPPVQPPIVAVGLSLEPAGVGTLAAQAGAGAGALEVTAPPVTPVELQGEMNEGRQGPVVEETNDELSAAFWPPLGARALSVDSLPAAGRAARTSPLKSASESGECQVPVLRS